jgi:hypothetical protein
MYRGNALLCGHWSCSRGGGVSAAIIGSFRKHYPLVLDAHDLLRSAGIEVTSPIGTSVLDPGKHFVRFASDSVRLTDPQVQTLALHRILRADAVLVIAPNGYVGRTTCYEIGRIIQSDVPLYFTELPVDLPLFVPPSHIAKPSRFVTILNSGQQRPLYADQRSGDWERRLIQRDYLDL